MVGSGCGVGVYLRGGNTKRDRDIDINIYIRKREVNWTNCVNTRFVDASDSRWVHPINSKSPEVGQHVEKAV